MVQKRPTRALYILDVPLLALAPELAVPSADDLGFKAHGCSGGRVRRNFGSIFTLGVTAYFYEGGFAGEGARYGREGQTGSVGARVEVRYESYTRQAAAFLLVAIVRVAIRARTAPR